MDNTLAFTIEIDGASRGNPGPAAFGYVIRHQGETVLEESGYLGRATNNAAEYLALIHALKKAEELRGSDLTIRSDSELLVRQMSGEYRVRNPQLAILHQQVSQLLPRFRRVRFTYVPREQNRDADRLCNEALNEAERNGLAAKDQRAGNINDERRAVSVSDGWAAGEDWRAALQEAETLLRTAGRTWAESGPESPSPRAVLMQIVRLLEAKGFLRRSRK